jgi:hypothetical protein
MPKSKMWRSARSLDGPGDGYYCADLGMSPTAEPAVQLRCQCVRLDAPRSMLDCRVLDWALSNGPCRSASRLDLILPVQLPSEVIQPERLPIVGRSTRPAGRPVRVSRSTAGFIATLASQRKKFPFDLYIKKIPHRSTASARWFSLPAVISADSRCPANRAASRRAGISGEPQVPPVRLLDLPADFPVGGWSGRCIIAMRRGQRLDLPQRNTRQNRAKLSNRDLLTCKPLRQPC